MKAWFLLAGAILSEVTGSLSLKAATEQPLWHVLVAVGFMRAGEISIAREVIHRSKIVLGGSDRTCDR